MPMYELVTKIAYALLTLTLLSMNFAGIPASYMNLETKVNQSHVEDYRKLAVLENVMTLDASNQRLNNNLGGEYQSYTYEIQRAVIPVEYFTQNNEGNEQLGYQRNGEHCYITNVPGLDGEELGFYVRKMDESRADDPGFSEPRELGCTEIKNQDESVYSPALLVRKANGNPRLPVRIYVYSIEEGEQS